MNQVASLFAFALLAAGCASSGGGSATTARAPLALPAQNAPQAAPRSVELRHFYLLSPGPGAKLVVTRSDVAPGPVSSAETSSAKAAAPLLGLQ